MVLRSRSRRGLSRGKAQAVWNVRPSPRFPLAAPLFVARPSHEDRRPGHDLVERSGDDAAVEEI